MTPSNPYLVYLSGPIASLSPQVANSWRTYAEERLKDISSGRVLGLNPIRHSNYIKQKQHTHMIEKADLSRNNDILPNKAACLSRDKRDVKICDLVLINCIGAPERISMGTCIETAWAHILDKPIIIAVEEGDKYDTDLLFSSLTEGHKYRDLDVAIENCVRYLLP